MPNKKNTQTSVSNDSQTYSEDERAAMRERALELKKGKKGNGENDLLAKIAEMEEPDKTIATRLHQLVKEHAPQLSSKTWYGMPAYAKDDKVVCFFQSASKFKARYATLGFSDSAKLDNGDMWPTSFALKKLTSAEEKRIVELIKKAVGI